MPESHLNHWRYIVIGVLPGLPGSAFSHGLGLRVRSLLGLIRTNLGFNNQGKVKFEVTTNQRFLYHQFFCTLCAN
ncbi:MAG: hypothetical protein ICV78_23100 [Tolypothrix sp. Co-bin9]|nr:hypothetical protein [Tolypothrix sp. Co-bin9]